MNNLEFIASLMGAEGQRLIRMRDANRCCAQAHAERYSLILSAAASVLEIVDLNMFTAWAGPGSSISTVIARGTSAARSSGRYLPVGLTQYPEITPIDAPEYLTPAGKQAWGFLVDIVGIAQPYVEPEALPAPMSTPIGGQVATAKKVLRCMEGSMLSQGSRRTWATLKKGGQTLKYTYVREP